MDTIFIRGLKTEAIIGIYEWERQAPQPLIFDIIIQLSIAKAAQSDQIHDTVDYKQLSDEIIQRVAHSRYELLESLCEMLCQFVLNHYASVHSIQLTVHKPQAVADAESVGLTLTRSREKI